MSTLRGAWPLGTGPVALLWRERFLIEQLARRELQQRYRGSSLGLLWLILNPLLLLAVYVFVFTIVLRDAHSSTPLSAAEFSLHLFAGLAVFQPFAQCLLRAPALLRGHAHLIKKTVFPLETLPCAIVTTALVQAAAGSLALVALTAAVRSSLHWSLLLLPLVWLPLMMWMAGFCWLLSSLGVFFEDIGQPLGTATTVLMFLSCVFHPASALPELIRPWIILNPVSFAIEGVRDVVLRGNMPDWRILFAHCFAGWAAAELGFRWFKKSSRSFADVL